MENNVELREKIDMVIAFLEGIRNGLWMVKDRLSKSVDAEIHEYLILSAECFNDVLPSLKKMASESEDVLISQFAEGLSEIKIPDGEVLGYNDSVVDMLATKVTSDIERAKELLKGDDDGV